MCSPNWWMSHALGRLRVLELKRPPKEPDRVYPMVKDQEYDRVYDWED